MQYHFQNREELFYRVRPALKLRCEDFKKQGFTDVRDSDIWNCLILNKWKVAEGLMLSDVVSDIMHIEVEEVNKYIEDEKVKRSYQLDDSEII